jgi:hypothetical protein
MIYVALKMASSRGSFFGIFLGPRGPQNLWGEKQLSPACCLRNWFKPLLPSQAVVIKDGAAATTRAETGFFLAEAR